MDKLESILARRLALARRYTEQLENHPWLTPPYIPDYAQPNFQSYAVTIAEDAPMTRDALMRNLHEAGVATRAGIMLIHQEPAYAGHAHGALPISEQANQCSLLLPLYPEMRPEDQDQVLRLLDLDAS